jgi:dienelactone hydrolase
MTASRPLLFVLLALLGMPAQADVPPVRDYVRHAMFNTVTLSPTGTYLAVSVPEEDKTILGVLRTADKSIVSKWDFGAGRHVDRVVWVGEERFLVYVSRKVGSLDFRIGTPDIFVTNADGTQRRELSLGGTYRLVDVMREDPRRILVQRTIDKPMLFRMDVFSGRTQNYADAPLHQGGFALDNELRVRYAFGTDIDGNFQTWQWDDAEGSWSLYHRQEDFSSGMRMPLRFDRDNRYLYMYVSDAGEPQRLVRYDPESGAMEELHGHPHVDMEGLLTASDGKDAFGVSYMPGLPRYHYFDPEHPEARLLRSLEAAFPDHHVTITSRTWDGRLALVYAYSDVDPGSTYLFDTESKQATFMLAQRPWIDPEKMSPMRPVQISARDGTLLHGYLTVPRQANGEGMPLIVNPHGGPHGPRDRWGFNWEVQLLASRGYAVLQVDFRGSGGYGQRFERSGYLRWGVEMQDDVTDATQWAIDQGIADPARICIYGGSYGGYAALMAVVREPDLYACSIGYVGVYSLPMMRTRGDIPRSDSGRRYLNRAVGTDGADLRARSPAYHAERIKAPVMLVHGRRDERVPIHQFYAMEKALKEAGKPPLTLVENREGHGFFDVDNRENLYTRMFAFLEQHIGPRTRAAADQMAP